MATGRTLEKWARVYVDGYDLSGYGRSIGPLLWEFDTADLTAPMSDAVKGVLPNHCNISPGVFNGVMQSTTDSGVEVSRIQTAGVTRDIMIPIGIRAAPAAGDPVYVCKASHGGLHVVEDAGAMAINATFGGWDVSDLPSYTSPWGVLVHALGAETAANTGDGVNNGWTTTTGGMFAYQVTSVTREEATNMVIKLQSCASADGDFADVTGATVTIETTDVTAGIIQVASSVTVYQYVRWQAVVTGVISVTFAMAWIPNTATGVWPT